MKDSIEGFQLSPQQDRLWPLQQGASAFNAQCIIRIQGSLNVELLKDSLRSVIAQHDSLRTTFYCISSVRVPIQVVNDEASLDWREGDLEGKAEAELRAEFENEKLRPFDLTSGPLVRALLLVSSERLALMAVTLPALLADSRSLSNLFQAIARSYASEAYWGDGAPAMAYSQYAEWQNQVVAEEGQDAHHELWRDGNIFSKTPMRLPFEEGKGADTLFSVGREGVKLPSSLIATLGSIAEANAASTRQFLLTCWVTLLWRLTRQSELLVALSYDGRIYEELSTAIGLFAKFLPAQFELHEGIGFNELWVQVQKTDEDLAELQDRFSYSQLWPSRGSAPAFLPFAFDFDQPCPAIDAGGTVFTLRQTYICIDQFNIKLSCVIQNDELLADFYYDTNLFKKADIQRLAQQFHQLVESAAQSPDGPLIALNMVSEDERRELIDAFNQTKVSYAGQEYLHTLFEEQVRLTPDRIAVTFQDEHLTFSGLNAQANQVSHYLQKAGIAPEAIVAVLFERSPILISSILGVLKTGGAYLPLDPSYPQERLAFLMADSKASILLTETRLADGLSSPGIQTLYLDRSHELLQKEEARDRNLPIQPEQLAYLIYTSGSTGKPKGVMITQSGLGNYLVWAREEYCKAGTIRSLVHSSISFDLTITALFAPLLIGGEVRLLPEGATLEDLADALNEVSGYDLVKITPTHMMALNSLLSGEQAKQRCRVLIVGGEALQGETVNAWRAHAGGCRIINEYGPTETVVGSSRFEVPETGLLEGAVPIGSAIANTQLYILDSQLLPVPVNLPGELYIGGDGVARGYFDRPEVTAEKFIPNPYGSLPGTRLYRSGDEAKRLHDGEIVYLGRMDQMVKIRGYRVEPGEIEAVLSQHPAIREAAVIPKVDSTGNTRLVAYYVAKDDSPLTPDSKALYKLPNGLQIAHINKNETDLLYKDIFLDESYLQCGVSLADGAVICDVGANIGLFTLYISQKRRDLLIYAFEPVPPIFEKLKTNVKLHGINAKIFNYGVSNRAREAEITYYPRASAMSGVYANAEEDAALMTQFLTNQDAALAEYTDDFLEGKFESKRFTSKFKRLSDIFRENEIETVDLLKVDVEKSEMDILEGIDSEDWHKIKQIVIEIHDLDGRLNKIREVLDRQGYEVDVRQEALLSHTKLYNLYAIQKSWLLRKPAKPQRNETSKTRPTSAIISVIELSNFLARKLPDYMIPASFIRLDSLPLSPNGKLDRQALPAEQVRSRSDQPLVQPRTKTEKLLVGIWQQLLQVSEVSIHDNFFELGGDSILSIQVIARAKQAGLQLVPKQLFQHQTIAELASIAKVAESPQAEQGIVFGSVSLTPIQHYFFGLDLPDPHHFNQSVLLGMRQEIDANHLSAALEYLLTHHDALRMRYEKTDSGWRQAIPVSTGATILTEIDISSLAEHDRPKAIEMVSAEMQTGLRLQEGPLVRVGLFNLGDSTPQRLFIVIHHLVVDGVSWRILLEDLAAAYQQLKLQSAIELPSKTTSFKQWAKRLVEYARSDAVLEELPFWLEQAQPWPLASFAEATGLSHLNLIGTTHSLRTVVSREETRALLQEVSRFYHAQLNEVLLTALAAAVWRWKGANSLRVDVEGHGREDIFDGLDISRTIGWFTTIFPVTLDPPDRGTGDTAFLASALRGIKEECRAVPRKGIGYGLLLYLSDSTEITEPLRRIPKAEVSFNYLGRFDYADSDTFLYQRAREATGHSRSPHGKRQYLLDINCQVLDGQLEVEWLYCEQIHQREIIEKLMADFNEVLHLLISQCQASERVEYSPSDFPSARLDPQRLERFAASGKEIDNIYPLAPNQEGILFHTLYVPGIASYAVPLNCKLRGALDVKAFRASWQQAVDKHDILRTGFVWQGVERPLQVVVRQAELPWIEMDWRGLSTNEQERQLKALLDEDSRTPFDLTEAPLMRFKLIRLDENYWHFNWVFHHLLFDGWSQSILLAEVFNAFEAIREGREYTYEPRRPYADYVSWLNQQEVHSAEEYWRETLKGFTTPTNLEHMKKGGNRASQVKEYLEQGLYFTAEESRMIESLARKYQVTLNTLVQGVWGVLLHHYSNQETVVFGAIVSGRSAEFAGIERMLGLFINTLPVRLDFDADAEFKLWLAQLQTQQAELRHYEYSPLAEVQKWSEVPRGQALFDSILVFENYPVEMALSQFQRSIEISHIAFKDPSHYPLTLTVACREQLSVRLTYDCTQFDEVTVRSMLDDFRSVMSGLMANPNGRLGEIEETLQDNATRQRLQKASELEARRMQQLKSARRKAVRQDIEEEYRDGKRAE